MPLPTVTAAAPVALRSGTRDTAIPPQQTVHSLSSARTGGGSASQPLTSARISKASSAAAGQKQGQPCEDPPPLNLNLSGTGKAATAIPYSNLVVSFVCKDVHALMYVPSSIQQQPSYSPAPASPSQATHLYLAVDLDAAASANMTAAANALPSRLSSSSILDLRVPMVKLNTGHLSLNLVAGKADAMFANRPSRVVAGSWVLKPVTFPLLQLEAGSVTVSPVLCSSTLSTKHHQQLLGLSCHASVGLLSCYASHSSLSAMLLLQQALSTLTDDDLRLSSSQPPPTPLQQPSARRKSRYTVYRQTSIWQSTGLGIVPDEFDLDQSVGSGVSSRQSLVTKQPMAVIASSPSDLQWLFELLRQVLGAGNASPRLQTYPPPAAVTTAASNAAAWEARTGLGSTGAVQRSISTWNSKQQQPSTLLDTSLLDHTAQVEAAAALQQQLGLILPAWLPALHMQLNINKAALLVTGLVQGCAAPVLEMAIMPLSARVILLGADVMEEEPLLEALAALPSASCINALGDLAAIIPETLASAAVSRDHPTKFLSSPRQPSMRSPARQHREEQQREVHLIEGAKVRAVENVSLVVGASLQLDVYNLDRLGWEPVLEPWAVQVRLVRTLCEYKFTGERLSLGQTAPKATATLPRAK